MSDKIAVFWFRRDLRLEDNRGLLKAIQSGLKVLPIFIFDPNILDQLDDASDRRVDYIHQAVSDLHHQLKKEGSGLTVFHDKPTDAFNKLLSDWDVDGVYCSMDYEPYANSRDAKITSLLSKKNIQFVAVKDQVIFEKSEVAKADGSPYTVYTPYGRKWRALLKESDYEPVCYRSDRFVTYDPGSLPSLEALGFQKTDMVFQSPRLEHHRIDDYDKYRDYPAEDRTTRLGIALRFGTISIRHCVRYALEKNDTWLSELIWRDFFAQILYHFPKVVDHCFKPQYESIRWRNDEDEFRRWCDGETGYPIVDAGMRQLNQTGFMHNRVRMVTASFLCKHLLVDWRWGEAYFAKKLNDYDLASNNGNWQWAAGCGCDAAPYFRIFNPTEQTRKFDKELNYIKRWNPGFEDLYREAIVDHKEARERALSTYKRALDH